MSWVAVAVGAGVAGSSAVQANQERQRKKGIIGRAYSIAQQRQAVHQGDVRESIGESVDARGLAGGGGVYDRGPAPTSTPGVGGAHTLGEQQMVDLTREQSLESQDLAARKSSDFSNINAEANSRMVGGVIEGIGAGFNLGGALHPPTAGGAGTTPSPSAVGVDSPSLPGQASPYAGSFAGVDPVDPLGRGAWKSGATTGGFNKYNEVG